MTHRRAGLGPAPALRCAPRVHAWRGCASCRVPATCGRTDC